LKHFLQISNLHTYNPNLFKLIEDISVDSDFTAKWTKQEFIDFFMNATLKKTAENKNS